MPEQLLNEFQIPGFLVNDGRRRVPERVESRRPARASDPEAIQRQIEHVTSQYIGVQRRAKSASHAGTGWCVPGTESTISFNCSGLTLISRIESREGCDGCEPETSE